MLITLKWLAICCLIGFFSGSASALFLYTLEWVTQTRNLYPWIIALLPLGGLLIGYCYYYADPKINRGNNLLLEEYNKPAKKIPLLMAPLVLMATLITHLFGGSAGREGTAVQMGGALADFCGSLFKLQAEQRRTIIIMGISGGFASVFGTPLAGALFALEIVCFHKTNLKTLLLSLCTAYIAYFSADCYPIKHTHYSISYLPTLDLKTVCWIVAVSILFGLAALLFARSIHYWAKLFSKHIKSPPLRPFIGGLILAISIYLIGTTKYIGLGVPDIVDSFTRVSAPYDFLLKTLFTAFTLGAGFKGGEVTPLFFVGASLGSALSTLVPLPIALLAGMGFVAVFSGATHSPIACTLMGIELFGLDSALYIALACTTAYFFSGTVGIYNSQIVKGPKSILYQAIRKKGLKYL